MSHLDEGTLHALLDGELEVAEVREIQMHLGTCAACGSRLQDVKQFLAEADRLVGALELPTGGTRAPSLPPTHHEPPAPRERVAPPPPPPQSPPPNRPFREPESWTETPPMLLLPDPLAGLERRRRWTRRMKWAAMIAVVFFGGRAIINGMGPSRPELQFTERDAAPPVPTPPAVVSPQETERPGTPLAKQSRPAPVNRETIARTAPVPARKARADQPAPDTALDQADTAAAAGVAAAGDTAPDDEVVALDARSAEPEAAQPPGEEADLATRRAASEALAELDRARIRERANAATAALPPPRTEVVEPAEAAPPPPRTLEQRAQIYLRIGLDEGARQLGRPVHVLEGMSPEFMGLVQGRAVPGADATRPVVRVVYQDSRERMILLDQQRMRTGQGPGAAGGNLRWTIGDVMIYLHGDLSPDALRALQRRVR